MQEKMLNGLIQKGGEGSQYLETVYSTTRRMWSCGPIAQRSWLVV